MIMIVLDENNNKKKKIDGQSFLKYDLGHIY